MKDEEFDLGTRTAFFVSSYSSISGITHEMKKKYEAYLLKLFLLTAHHQKTPLSDGRISERTAHPAYLEEYPAHPTHPSHLAHPACKYPVENREERSRNHHNIQPISGTSSTFSTSSLCCISSTSCASSTPGTSGISCT